MSRAEIAHYGQLLKVVRARIVELGIPYDTVDEIAGFPLRYTAKLLNPASKKIMSVYSMLFAPGRRGAAADSRARSDPIGAA